MKRNKVKSRFSDFRIILFVGLFLLLPIALRNELIDEVVDRF